MAASAMRATRPSHVSGQGAPCACGARSVWGNLEGEARQGKADKPCVHPGTGLLLLSHCWPSRVGAVRLSSNYKLALDSSSTRKVPSLEATGMLSVVMMGGGRRLGQMRLTS